MFEKLAIWYLSRTLKKAKIYTLEIGITSDGWTYHKRNKEKEESIKKILAKIKQRRNKRCEFYVSLLQYKPCYNTSVKSFKNISLMINN